jgi:hypothetical protein
VRRPSPIASYHTSRMLRSVHHNGLHRVAAQVDVVLVRPAAFTFITSVSRLRAGFSLHFPVNGLSAAHTVPLARQIHSHTQIECLAIDSSTSTEFLWPSACTAKTTRRLVCILVRRSRTDDDFLSELELSAAHSHPACVACRVPQPQLFSCEQQRSETGHSYHPARLPSSGLGSG